MLTGKLDRAGQKTDLQLVIIDNSREIGVWACVPECKCQVVNGAWIFHFPVHSGL